MTITPFLCLETTKTLILLVRNISNGYPSDLSYTRKWERTWNLVFAQQTPAVLQHFYIAQRCTMFLLWLLECPDKSQDHTVSSVTQSCPTLRERMNCSTPGLLVHHQLPESTQTHVHRVSDAIQPSPSSVIPFSSCPQSLPATGSFPMSQLFA